MSDYYSIKLGTLRAFVRFGLALLAFIAAATGYAAQTAATGVRINAAQLKAPASEKRANYEYHVLAGEMALQRDKPAIAAREYAAALAYSKAPALAHRTTQIAVLANKRKLAYRAARIWADAAPQSQDAQQTAVRLAFLAGDEKRLQRYASRLIAAAPTAEAGYHVLAQLLIGNVDRADLAITTLGRLARQHAQRASAQYALGVIALHYDRLPIDAAAAASTSKLAPHWNQAALLQAGVWVRQGHSDKAIELIAGLAGDTSMKARDHSALARMLVSADQPRAARGEFAQALKIQPDNTPARYGMAILSLTLGDLDRAQDALEKLYDNDQHRDDAAYYLGSVAEQRGHYAQAQTWYQRVHGGAHAFEAQLRTARVIAQQGDLASARKHLTRLRQAHPEQSTRILAAEGQLLSAAGRYNSALKVYNRGLKRHPKANDLYYGRSLVYARLGRIEQAESDLHAMLARNHDDPRALNALGYMLTNHSHHYHKALGYIRKALAARPDAPAIEDSMGWVQYHLGHLHKARNYLEKAYARQPDPEIAAHLGEVRWQQGERTAARRIWQHAVAHHPHDPVLRATMKRFGQ